ncbi:MAG: hypothetical protein Q8Q33_10720 [Chlamydiota bacterium]|nr:hypothetical protein [Chlamydiota bacterium]
MRQSTKHIIGLIFVCFSICLSLSAQDEKNLPLPETQQTAEPLLLQAREDLYQEWVHFQIMGRAHSPDEVERIEHLESAIKKIDEAIALIQDQNTENEPRLF